MVQKILNVEHNIKGNLKITISDRELFDEVINDTDVFQTITSELLEYNISNSDCRYTTADNINQLSESDIIYYDGKVFYFPDYQIIHWFAPLINNGSVEFVYFSDAYIDENCDDIILIDK